MSFLAEVPDRVADMRRVAALSRERRTVVPERLVIFGDFNCPFCALASARADVLLATGNYEISWRAIQHDTGVAESGEVLGEAARAALAAEIAQVFELSARDLRLRLAVPATRPNTALACQAFAAAPDPHRTRRRLFAAVWAEGRNISKATELGRIGASGRNLETARVWQSAFDALERPITPTLVLPDGYVSRGLGALRRLADLAAASATT